MKSSQPILALAALSSLFGMSQLLVAPAVANQPPVAGSFYCDTSGAVPATMIRTVRGDETFIKWENSFGNKYTKAQRCQIVTKRFQSWRGNLYLTSSNNVNGYPVICNVGREGGTCDGSNILVTLRKNADHKLALQKFLSHQKGASNAPLYLSGDSYISVVGDNYYINVGRMIGNINEASTEEQPINNTPEPVEPPAEYRRY
jgi:Circadian oscillating protein COP23